MKKFIKKWLMLFGLASISATIIPAIVNDYWDAGIFSIQLLIMLFVVCLLQLVTEKIPLKLPLFKYLIDLVIALLLGLFFGLVWKWYTPSYVWMMFSMVIPVYVIGYFLDIVKVNKDVKAINQQIKRRREKLQQEIEDRTNDC